MNLERPIVFFDVETTGLDLANDRIIEISMIKIIPGQTTYEKYYKKLNPEGRPITPEAQSKHGLSLEDLQECPTFAVEANNIHEFITNCDLGGYNCKRFDIPILIEEFLRAGKTINISDFNIVDVFKILQKSEPRTLEATYKRFMGKELEGAHGAEADILGTIEIHEKMEEVFGLPTTVKELHELAFGEEQTIDLENKLKRTEDKKVIFNFGKYKGQDVGSVYRTDPGYFDWIIQKSDMTRLTKTIFSNIVKFIKMGKL